MNHCLLSTSGAFVAPWFHTAANRSQSQDRESLPYLHSPFRLCITPVDDGTWLICSHAPFSPNPPAASPSSSTPPPPGSTSDPRRPPRFITSGSSVEGGGGATSPIDIGPRARREGPAGPFSGTKRIQWPLNRQSFCSPVSPLADPPEEPSAVHPNNLNHLNNQIIDMNTSAPTVCEDSPAEIRLKVLIYSRSSTSSTCLHISHLVNLYSLLASYPYTLPIRTPR